MSDVGNVYLQSARHRHNLLVVVRDTESGRVPDSDNDSYSGHVEQISGTGTGKPQGKRAREGGSERGREGI